MNPETLSARLRRRIRRSESSDYLSESDVDDVEALELRLAEAVANAEHNPWTYRKCGEMILANEGLQKRLEALDARCSAPGVSIIVEDFIDNTVAWMEQYKKERDEARKQLEAAEVEVTELQALASAATGYHTITEFLKAWNKRAAPKEK